MTRRLTAAGVVAALTLAWTGPVCAQAAAGSAPASSVVDGEAAPGTSAPPPEIEPPPAPLEEPEPEPAPLIVEKTEAERAAEARAQQAAQEDARRRAISLRGFSAAAWTGVALTVGLAVTGTALGILAQQRSDAQSRLTTQIVDGLPPIYDAAQDREWNRLQDEGARFNAATIGCLVSAGVLAAGSGLLFWGRERRFGKDLALSVPSLRFDSKNVALTIGGRF